VAIERSGVVLGEYEYAMYVRVDAIRDGDINEAVFAAERHGRLGPLFGERIEPLPHTSAQNHRYHAFGRHSHSPLIDSWFHF